ncbi:cytochrome P450 [Crepidotus variabilis]|uniref:Cytochrome P450 n=1 Tax=Crepidotus variabilis TaxID=179855 RepID=A0A9P6ERG4_9AGAR|nr:cytochrome P450 [Crepidotus variabilis]
MYLVVQVFSATVLALLAYIVLKLVETAYREWKSPLKVLPGPSSPSFLYGNMKQIWDAEAGELHEKWVEEFGSTFRYQSFVGMSRFYTTDTKALNHMLMNSSIYQKPESVRYNLTELLGPGVLVVEGDKHKQQRKVMNPAFGAAQIRELTEIFVEKALLMRDIWLTESQKEENKGRIDVLSWLGRMTLDVIGLAGFNYHFNALTNDPEQNELNKAFTQIFRARSRMSLVNMGRSLFPVLRYVLPNFEKDTIIARNTMARIGEKLLSDSRAALSSDASKMDHSGSKRRDLLSLLMKANSGTDLAPSQTMSDEDVLAQVPTFLVAGHETTSTATTWALFALTQAPVVQAKLREELLTVSTDNPTMDELNALPYLDAVVHETLRLHTPVTSTIRIAAQDDIMPLGKPVLGRNGEMIDRILIKKGQTMLLPILAINRAESIWGEDARQFKPERWTESKNPESVSTIPGVWGNLMTFIGGPRACIGYRFSLVEMKALLFTLVRAFEFELAVPAEDIRKKTSVVQRPLVASEKEKGHQMPLRLKPFTRV